MKRQLFIVAVALLLASGLAVAQETTSGSIAGRVVDAQDLPVPGAAVTITGPTGARTEFTDAEGRFFVPFLAPATYAVRVELQGFKTIEQPNVPVSLGQRVSLDLMLETGQITEVVEVTGTTPIVDASSTTTGAVIDDEFLKSVPVGRSLSDTLYLAPGVSDAGQLNQTQNGANPSISGGSGLENAYIVDGVNITNAGYGALGSYSIVFGSLGSGVTFDFIEEVQVKTGGFEAEFGQATGGVINVVTKSGSNELQGALFGYASPDALEASHKTVQSPNGSVNNLGNTVSDIGVQIGGPVLQNKLFYFASVNPQWETVTRIAPADVENFPLRAMGEVDRKRQITGYSAKATYQYNPSHRFDASFFGDPATGDLGPQRISSLLRQDNAAFSEITYGGHNQIVKYDGVINSSWLIEAAFSRAANKISEEPLGNEWSVIDQTVDPQIRSGGLGFYEVGNDGKKNQFQVKSTHLWREHQIRYGFQYDSVKYDNIIQRTGPTIRLSDGSQTVTGADVRILPAPELPGGVLYRAVRGNLSNIRETEQQYTSFFVQDNWQINDRLTLQPGIRYEQQKLVGNLADFTWDGNWGPRIGATYDLLGDGRSKLYGFWGRFYAQIPNDLAARALSADASITRADYFDAALTNPIPEGVLAGEVTEHLQFAGLNPAAIDPDSKSTSQDEVLVGFEMEVFPGTNVGARYIHRQYNRILEDIGQAPMVAYDLGLPGLESVEYFITNPDEATLVQPQVPGVPAIAFEAPIHDYDALELTASRRFSDNWAVHSSYRLARLHGTFEGFFRNDNGQSDPGITSLYDFPTNDASYTQIGVPQFGYRGDIRFLGAAGAGPLPNDRRHQLKVFTNYLLDMGLNLGLGFAVGSGRPLTTFAANPVYDSSGEIPEGPRGSGVDTIDGSQTRTPAEASVDFHADYALPIGNQRLVLLADVFNLFNRRAVTWYDQDTETGFNAPNSDYGWPVLSSLSRFQRPFYLRVGARFEF